MMRDDSVSELDLLERNIGVEGGMLLGYLMPVMGGLKSIDLSGNQLCGIWTDGYGNQQGAYTAEGITAIANALRVNCALTSLDLSNNALCGVVQTFSRVFSSGPDGVSGTYTAEGITAIADALRVNGGLTAVDLSNNYLKDEGVSAVCKAIQSNKETKLASLNMGRNGIGPVGVKSVAAIVAVTGALTALNLSSNLLKDEGVSAVCKAIQSNKETKLTSLNFEDNGIGPVGANAVAAMVAGTGALTQVIAF